MRERDREPNLSRAQLGFLQYSILIFMWTNLVGGLESILKRVILDSFENVRDGTAARNSKKLECRVPGVVAVEC